MTSQCELVDPIRAFDAVFVVWLAGLQLKRLVETEQQGRTAQWLFNDKRMSLFDCRTSFDFILAVCVLT